jgi:hypothetical protein
VRELVRERIAEVIASWDAHDPGIQQWVTPHVYACPSPCGFRGTEAEWEQHLADALSTALVTQTAELG